MSAEIVNLAERRTADKAEYVARLERLREQARAGVVELNSLLALIEELIASADTMTGDEFSVVLQKFSGAIG